MPAGALGGGGVSRFFEAKEVAERLSSSSASRSSSLASPSRAANLFFTLSSLISPTFPEKSLNTNNKP